MMTIMTTGLLVALLIVAVLSMAVVGKLCNSLMRNLTSPAIFGLGMGLDNT